jgi:hypothetical protein
LRSIGYDCSQRDKASEITNKNASEQVGSCKKLASNLDIEGHIKGDKGVLKAVFNAVLKAVVKADYSRSRLFYNRRRPRKVPAAAPSGDEDGTPTEGAVGRGRGRIRSRSHAGSGRDFVLSVWKTLCSQIRSLN